MLKKILAPSAPRGGGYNKLILKGSFSFLMSPLRQCSCFHETQDKQEKVDLQYKSTFGQLCPKSKTKICVACEKGYHLENEISVEKLLDKKIIEGQNLNLTSYKWFSNCKQNKCSCQNGVAALGSTDKEYCAANTDISTTLKHKTFADLPEFCKKCNDGYYINQRNTIEPEPYPDGYKYDIYSEKPHYCFPRQCTCANGQPVKRDNCFGNGQESCLSCSEGYYLAKKLKPIVVEKTGWYAINKFKEESACFENRKCQCENGVGGENEACHVADVVSNSSNSDPFNCVSCNEGYFLEQDAENPNGPNICSPNRTCICAEGPPATNEKCPKNGEFFCDSCNDDQKTVQPDGTCQVNICKCEHGQGKTGPTCKKMGEVDCKCCNPGISSDRRYINGLRNYRDECVDRRSVLSNYAFSTLPICR